MKNSQSLFALLAVIVAFFGCASWGRSGRFSGNPGDMCHTSFVEEKDIETCLDRAAELREETQPVKDPPLPDASAPGAVVGLLPQEGPPMGLPLTAGPSLTPEALTPWAPTNVCDQYRWTVESGCKSGSNLLVYNRARRHVLRIVPMETGTLCPCKKDEVWKEAWVQEGGRAVHRGDIIPEAPPGEGTATLARFFWVTPGKHDFDVYAYEVVGADSVLHPLRVDRILHDSQTTPQPGGYKSAVVSYGD